VARNHCYLFIELSVCFICGYVMKEFGRHIIFITSDEVVWLWSFAWPLNLEHKLPKQNYLHLHSRLYILEIASICNISQVKIYFMVVEVCSIKWRFIGAFLVFYFQLLCLYFFGLSSYIYNLQHFTEVQLYGISLVRKRKSNGIWTIHIWLLAIESTLLLTNGIALFIVDRTGAKAY
jgi:hypothetical protein